MCHEAFSTFRVSLKPERMHFLVREQVHGRGILAQDGAEIDTPEFPCNILFVACPAIVSGSNLLVAKDKRLLQPPLESLQKLDIVDIGLHLLQEFALDRAIVGGMHVKW